MPRPNERHIHVMLMSVNHITHNIFYKVIENSVLNSATSHDKVQVFQFVKQPSDQGGDIHGRHMIS